MKKFSATLLLLTLAVLLAAPLLAADKKKKRNKKRGRTPQAVSAMAKKLKGLDLTSEQAGKIKEIRSEFGPKFAALGKKSAGILSKEQRQARNEARKAAAAEGKKGKELQAAVAAAIDLSDADKEALGDLRKAQRELGRDFRGAISAVLTAEQKEKAGLNGKARKGKGKRKGKRKKKDA